MDPYAEMYRDFIKLFNQQIAQDTLTEIRAKLPGHSEPYYNNILNKAQAVARASGNKSTYDVVLSKEFWEQL